MIAKKIAVAAAKALQFQIEVALGGFYMPPIGELALRIHKGAHLGGLITPLPARFLQIVGYRTSVGLGFLIGSGRYRARD